MAKHQLGRRQRSRRRERSGKEPDGSFTVLGTHEYKKFGRYPISVQITGHRTKGEGQRPP